MNYSDQTQKLFELYRDLDQNQVEDEAAVATQRDEDEARYALSQMQLMWRKFVRNRAALVGGIVIILFYLGALFANLIAPYSTSTRFRERL